MLIQKVALDAMSVTGIKVRTKNSNESQPTLAKIAPLWRRFEKEIRPSLQKGATIYGVYHNYEYDAWGEYDVLVGSDQLDESDGTQSITIAEGRYLIFPVKGDLPEAMFQTWQEIWHYFADESVDERREYKTDFERYTSENEVEIYIGVNYF